MCFSLTEHKAQKLDYPKLDSNFIFNLFPKIKSEPLATNTFSLQSEVSKLRHVDSKTKRELRESISFASKETDLPEKLIFLLIKHESSFRKYVVSSAGAAGFTQLMPSTAKNFCNLASDRIFDTKVNILCGSKYLKRLMDEFGGDVQLALAAYNAGPNRIRRLISHSNGSFKDIKNKIPKETKSYVAVIGNSYFKTV
ncbi:MAG: lytic transglycosylase domain-containing protein [Candidatus Caenarcaniphilales bacterium]|nr:lytic transglycosylase domain-containing protein [Candidatus Caenarcaniphilales bacterium]